MLHAARPGHWLWAMNRQPRRRMAVQAHAQRSLQPLRRPPLSQTVSIRHKLLHCAPLPRGLRQNPRCFSSTAPPKCWEAKS